MRQSIILLSLLLFLVENSFSQESKLFLSGMANIRKLNFSAAEESFTHAIAAQEFSGKSFYYRGISRMNTGNITGAKTDFKIARDSNITDALFMLAKINAYNIEADEAVKNLSLFLELKNNYNSGFYIKDQSFKTIYSSQAWQDFVTSYKVSFIEEAIIEATYLIKRNDFKSAIGTIDQALLQAPNSGMLHALKSRIYKEEGLYSLARQEIKKSIENKPNDAEFLELAGDYSCLLREYNEAFNYFEKAKKVLPEEFDNYLKIARVNLALNKPEEAGNSSDIYLSFFPDDTAAIFLSAQINYHKKNYTAVFKQVNKLMEKNLPRFDWFLLRGLAYYETNTYKYAAYDLSMCLDLDPNNPQANYFLGLSQFKLGNQQLACYYWKRAEKAGDLRAIEQLLNNCSN